MVQLRRRRYFSFFFVALDEKKGNQGENAKATENWQVSSFFPSYVLQRFANRFLSFAIHHCNNFS